MNKEIEIFELGQDGVDIIVHYTGSMTIEAGGMNTPTIYFSPEKVAEFVKFLTDVHERQRALASADQITYVSP